MNAIGKKQINLVQIMILVIIIGSAQGALLAEEGKLSEPVTVRSPGNKPATLWERGMKKTRSRNQEEYRLKKGDRIKVTIYPEDEYVRGGEVLITDNGDIRIHTVGKVNVADKTVLEAEGLITEVLRDYFVEPAVVIELLESKEMSIVILGQVRRPGTYPMPMGQNRFTLMEAIALAGGFSELANIKKITITTKDKEGNALRKKANADDILQGEEDDVELYPNDIVNVPESLF